MTLSVNAYDATDAETEGVPKVGRVLDVLSAETNSAFWPASGRRDAPDEPLAKPVERVEAFADDPAWMDDYPIRDGLFLLSPEGVGLLNLVAADAASSDVVTLLRACNHFHTARKYAAQVTDVLEGDDPVPTPGGAGYSISLRVRDRRLEAAGRMGAAHAEITGTLYMSALEVASKIGGPPTGNCASCGQPQYKISQRVADLLTRHGGEQLGKLSEEYYAQRSQYLHEGSMLGTSNYVGTSIPQLDPSSPTGCAVQSVSPSLNLKEYAGFCLRKVSKQLLTSADG